MCSLLSSLELHWTGPLITFTKRMKKKRTSSTLRCDWPRSHQRMHSYAIASSKMQPISVWQMLSSSMRVCASANEAIEIYFYSSMRWKCLLNWQSLRFDFIWHGSSASILPDSYFAHLNDDAWRHRSSTVPLSRSLRWYPFKPKFLYLKSHGLLRIAQYIISVSWNKSVLWPKRELERKERVKWAQTAHL